MREVNGLQVPPVGTYRIDPAHSRVGFAVRHLMVSKVRGRLDSPVSNFVVAEDPLASSVEVVLDWATVDTGQEKRDTHLKSADFIDVDAFPHIVYRSDEVKHVAGSNWQLAGQLTIKDISRPVVLDLELTGAARDAKGDLRIGFEAGVEIDRRDYGLTWNKALETGGFMVDNAVTITIDIEAIHDSATE